MRNASFCQWACLCFLSMTCLSGCVTHRTESENHTFTYALSGVIGLAALGVVLTAGGVWIVVQAQARGARRWMPAGALLIFGTALLVLMVPGLYTDRVKVTPGELETAFGFYGTTVRSIRFEDVTAFTVERRRVRGGRGSTAEKNFYVFGRFDGNALEWQENDLLLQARPVIEALLGAQEQKRVRGEPTPGY